MLTILLGGTLDYLFLSRIINLSIRPGTDDYNPPSSLWKIVSIVFNTTGNEVNTHVVTNIRCIRSNISNVPFKDVILSSWTEANGTVMNVDDNHLISCTADKVLICSVGLVRAVNSTSR